MPVARVITVGPLTVEVPGGETATQSTEEFDAIVGGGPAGLRKPAGFNNCCLAAAPAPDNTVGRRQTVRLMAGLLSRANVPSERLRGEGLGVAPNARNPGL